MPKNSEMGAFLPTTDVFDRSTIAAMDVQSPEFKDFLVRLYQRTNEIALAINIRDAGFYVEEEFINGQQWFQNKALTSKSSQSPQMRQVYRKVIDAGALPGAAGTQTTAHEIGITTSYSFTRIYGAASDTTALEYLPIPYATATANDIIELSVDDTNVYVTVGKDRSSFDTCYIVLEYIAE